MTSVPKPLKFLRPHYRDLQALYETWPSNEDKSLFAGILSVLAMTYSDTEPRGTLRYRLLAGSMSTQAEEPGSWGHEYVRHLAAELGSEFEIRQENKEDLDELRNLAIECSKFLLHHNAEPDAVDLLEALEIVDQLVTLADSDNYSRVCAYMIRCAPSVASTRACHSSSSPVVFLSYSLRTTKLSSKQYTSYTSSTTNSRKLCRSLFA